MSKPAPPPQKTQKVLLGLVLASSIASVVAIVWWKSGDDGRRHGRHVDPEHISGDVEDMTETAESFVLFWSTFQYEEATHVSTGDSLARVRLAIEKEKNLSAAERQLARQLRKTVEGLEVVIQPHEVIEEGTDQKILRATALVKASDRTVRREQEFMMVREAGLWKVSSWDPGEPEGDEDAVEPGLQFPAGMEPDGGAP